MSAYYSLHGRKRFDIDKLLKWTLIINTAFVCGLWGGLMYLNYMQSNHSGIDPTNYVRWGQTPEGYYIPHDELKGRLQ